MKLKDLRKFRMLVVANAEPYQKKEKNGRITQARIRGGLTTALDPLMQELASNKEIPTPVWIGWGRGPADFEGVKESYKEKTPTDYWIKRIQLTAKEEREFYLGFSNEFVWFLFHGFWREADFKHNNWETYKSVNWKFAKATLEEHQSQDLVWVHDYHLMLMPKMVREKKPNSKIVFFLHVPWPVWDNYQRSPEEWRIKNIEGILGSDLIGFHTDSYRKKFCDCLNQLKLMDKISDQIEIDNSKIRMPSGREVKLITAPLGIDFETYKGNEKTREEAQKLKRDYSDNCANKPVFLIFGLDREDPTKGIFERLEAYELFLEREKQKQEDGKDNFYGQTILVQKLSPSRTDLPAYQKLREKNQSKIGEIVLDHSVLGGWTPAGGSRQHLSRKTLIEHNHIADIGLVTPLRDGMNLVSKEFVMGSKQGVLILSETAGAAEQLAPEAIIVNPYDTREIADAIHQALTMSKEEKVRRLKILKQKVIKEDLDWWRNKFLEEIVKLFN